jgi:ribosomal protein S18 acetylase RimI-like enzyme
LPKSIPIRDLDRADIPYARAVLEGTGLFPPDMLQPMAEPYLTGQAPHHWLVAYEGEQFAGFVYAEPERMTDGTFNLLAMAVDPALQGRGIGTALVAALEARLRGQGGRILLVETSGLQEYAGTRTFYARQSFSEEARIREFYAEGEDKILFWKRL